MSDQHEIERLNNSLDFFIETGDFPKNLSVEEEDLLETAKLFIDVDLSANSQSLDSIRFNLIELGNGMQDRLTTEKIIQFTGEKPMKRNLLLKSIVASVVAIILLGVVILTVPPIRAFAQDIIDDLFPRTEEETIDIIYNEFDPEDVMTFETSIELGDAVDFDVLLPIESPDRVTSEFYQYNVARNVTTQVYITPRRVYTVSQQPVDDALSNGLLAFSFDLEIPAQADVIEVFIGTTIGELVWGMWTGDETTGFTWSNRYYRYALRWQDDNYVYEITLEAAGGAPTRDMLQEEIIEFAEYLLQ